MMQAIFETTFDAVYLATVITLGVIMLRRATRAEHRLFGLMAILLGSGDAFHLAPRAWALLTDGLQAHVVALGAGKLITSLTMTVFYVLLYHIYLKRYGQSDKRVTCAIYALAILRVALCLPPQNAWLSAEPPLLWGIVRNIPFALLGALIIYLFYRETRSRKDQAFRHMPIAIALSFLMYIPVVLFSGTFPLVGMLMIPKTLAYVWIVVMGYQAMRRACKAPI